MARSKKAQEMIDDAFAANLIRGQVGLGVDIVEISRMRKILKRTPSFARRVFSEDEQRYCDKTSDPAVHYATRFAAKEAVVKALGTGFSDGVGVRDIEVKRNSKGRPYAALHGRAKQVAHDLEVQELPISLSYTHGDAIACAIAITKDSHDPGRYGRDEKDDMAKRFKEARAMLDGVV